MMNEALIAAIAAASGAAIAKGVDLFISLGKARQDLRKSDQDYVTDQYRRLIEQLERQLARAQQSQTPSPAPADLEEVKRRVEVISQNVISKVKES